MSERIGTIEEKAAVIERLFYPLPESGAVGAIYLCRFAGHMATEELIKKEGLDNPDAALAGKIGEMASLFVLDLCTIAPEDRAIRIQYDVDETYSEIVRWVGLLEAQYPPNARLIGVGAREYLGLPPLVAGEVNG